MKYVVEVNGERREVELDGPAARIGDREVAVNLEPIEGTPAEFGRLIADETEKWAKVVKFAGLKVE